MTLEDYQRAEVIMQDLKALTNCGIPSSASEELKKEFSDWVKKKKEYLQNEFANLEENVEKCYCKTTDYLTIRREVIGYGRSLVVGIDFKKKAITTYYDYDCDSGTSKNLNIEYCPLCGEKL